MRHHLSFGVSDIHRSAAFYDAALAPLGYVRVWDDLGDDSRGDRAVGYGVEGGDDQFAIKERADAAIAPPAGFHVAFAAADRASVHAFYAAAIANGGRDNGSPGPRPDYGPNDCAAFVVDPDGYRVEAVINEPRSA